MKEGVNESARVSAANSLLDRGWGKASQPIENGEEGDFKISVSWLKS